MAEKFRTYESLSTIPMDKNIMLQKSSAGEESLSGRFPYRELIGSLMYAGVSTRLDIIYSVTYLARFMTCFNETHWKAAKQVLKYLNKTKTTYLKYKRTDDFAVSGYSDASWASDRETRRSISGYVFKLGAGAISWKSRLQNCVASSTLEAEYIA